MKAIANASRDFLRRLAVQLRPGWPRATLRAYLVLTILLAVVPLVGLMSYQIVDQARAQRTNMQAEILRSAKTLAHSVNRELESSIDALDILAHSAAIKEGDVEFFERGLRTRPLPRRTWSGMYLVGLDGKVLFDTSHPAAVADKARDPISLLQQFSEQQAVVSDLQFDRLTGTAFTTVEVAVNAGQVPRYVLGARIPVSSWQQLGAAVGVPETGISAIIDRSFHFIMRNRLPERFVGTLVPESNQTPMRASDSGTVTMRSVERGDAYAAWNTIPLAKWYAAVGMPIGPIDAAYRQAIFVALATTASCLLLGVYLALLVARNLAVPLHLLARREYGRIAAAIPVKEISLLRDALVNAKAQDERNRERLRRKRDLLQNKADEFKTLLASSPVAIGFAQDRECQHITHNSVMDQMFGKPGPGHPDLQILENGVLLSREQLPLQRAAALGETLTDRELEVRVDGGPSKFVLCNAVPLLDENGRPRGAITAALDITARKTAEESLIEAERQLRESQCLVDLAQESGQVGFFHYRVDEDVLSWTPGQAKLFGFGEQQVESLAQWTQRIDRNDLGRVARHLNQAVAKQQESTVVDYRVNHSSDPDGDSRWLSSRVHLIYAPDGKAQQMIGITVDMSEQKHAEIERDALIVREHAARLEAEAANRAKDEFLATLGHELRNPLAAISSGVDVLQRVDSDIDVADNARRIVARQTRHLSHLLDDLLDVAGVMTGRIVLERQPLDFAALVRRVAANFEITDAARAHELVLEVEEVWVDASATRVEQLVSNLMVNAVKYTPPGGRIVVCVSRDDSQGREEALLQVCDNGPGIEPELLPRVFDLFVQGDRSLDRRGGGMGIGLTLVRRLAELHGGHVHAENAKSGPGAVISVRLPAIARPVAKMAAPAALTVRQLRIVIIEDNEDVLDGLSTTLKLAGHTVLTANEGVSGLAIILGSRPDVAIIDIGLPGMSGYDIARRSRAGGYPGRMIALTGYGQENDKRQALAAGFDAHLLKPASTHDLLRIIAE